MLFQNYHFGLKGGGGRDDTESIMASILDWIILEWTL